MCDCFHLAFPNWHAASSGTGPGRRLRAPEPGTEDDSTCDEPSQFTERERPRPQGSSPVEEYPETEKYTDSDKEGDEEHDPHHKSGSGKKTKKSGLGSMFEKRSTPKMSKLKEVHSPESGVIVKTAKDGCAEGLVYGGGGKDGIFIKEVVPESPASKSLKLQEGDQILSATVYFDNMSYEDAMQILEHAQAYKVKLCLKRKPHITESEPAIQSDVIPEEEVYTPEMREQGKTKRRGDARISWPKFPSFGKGRKSRFTRSHSSSEADEQRKLELSPTTSDTESPIKTQDALKGKKKQKIKLSALTKRGRISSSEDQDTDAPTSVQLLSPECLESPSGETPQVYMTEEVKVVEDLRCEQSDQKLTESQTIQHKVELITIDSTLKTEDLTVAMAGQESPSGKKKKKERSELKMRILSKDKSHKKSAKEKSPKRLKTLGASIEIADEPETERVDVPHTAVTTRMDMTLPKAELEISDVALIQKSPQKGEEKTKKGKDIKQKQETKTGPTFKLPKVGFGDIATEDTIPEMNIHVEGFTTEPEQLTTEGTEAKEDPYERLSKSSLSRTKLPKREDIEIPGMEDISMRTTATGIKEPKLFFTGQYEDIQAETVQLSIDVDSVKEAVSKLPGFKLPKVDTSGVPIPEEITVIDANAQRISVKTPTKIKHDAHFSKFDETASQEISKTTIKLPKITHADLISDDLLMVTHVKPEKEYKNETKQSDKEVYKRENITIPGKESADGATIFQTQETQGTESITSEYQSAATFKSKRAKISMPSVGIAKPDIRIPDVGIHLPKGDNVKGERKIFLQEAEISKQEKKSTIGGVVSDVKIPEIDGIEYIDSVDGSPAKKDGGIRLTGVGVKLDATSPTADICFPDIRGEVKYVEAEEHTFKLPKFGAVAPDISIDVSDANRHLNNDGAEVKTPEREGKGGKFKIPNLGISIPKVKGQQIDSSPSKKDIAVTLPEAKAEVKLPEAPGIDVTFGTVEFSSPEQKMVVEKPELEIKPLKTERELDGQGSKFKMSGFGVKMPKIKGPEIDLSLSKKDVDITLPEAKVETKLHDDEYKEPVHHDIKAPETALHQHNIEGSPSKFKMPTFKLPTFGVGTPNVSVEVHDMDKDVAEANINRPTVNYGTPSVDVEGPSIDVKDVGTEHDGKGSKFKMPHLGFSMPKVKGPQLNLSSSKKDVDVTLPEVSAEIGLPEAPKIDAILGKAECSIPEVEVGVKKPEVKVRPLQTEVELEGQGGKLQMPKLGITIPKVKGTEIHFDLPQKDGDVTLPKAKAEVKVSDAPKGDVSLGKVDVSLPKGKFEVKKPALETKPLQSEVGVDGQGAKFKMPKLGMSMPKVKGPDIHFGLSQKDADVTLPEVKAEVKVLEVEQKESSAKMEIKAPEIKIEAKAKEGSPSKFKMPTFKLPKFGVSTPNVEVPELDKNVKIDGADINIPDEGSAIHIAAPSIETEGPSTDMKTTGFEQDGKGSKFKMPHLGFAMPKVKGPKIDVSLSKNDTDVKLPETKDDVKLPEVDLGKVDVSIPEAKIEVKKPAMEMPFEMQTEGELDGQGDKLKMPKFGISIPKIKGPEIDFRISKKEVDSALPEAKAEVNLPDAELKKSSAKVEIKAPEIDVKLGSVKGSPSKFKMPTFTFPRFGAATPKAIVEGPDLDKDIEIAGTTVDVTAPSIDTEGLSVDVKAKGGELEGPGSKFKMPKLGISMPKVKGPDIDLSLSKKDADVTLPDAEAEVQLPDVNIKQSSVTVEIKAPTIEAETGNVEGSPSKFKMPTFTLPKFGAATPKVSVEVPDVKKDIEIDGATVDVTAPNIDTEGLSVDVKAKGGELEGPGSKFKMSKFGISMPKVKGPDIDLSLSKKDADVTLPDAEAEVQLPDVNIKQPSATVEIKAPKIEAQAGNVEGSPSKFKMPTFTLPKFGAATPKVSVEVPDVKKDIEIDGATVDVTAPNIDTEGLSVDVKAKGGELEGSGSKFKMPKFGISMPKVKGPEIDLSLSKKDADVKLPEAKAQVELPDVNIKQPSATVEIKAPKIEAQAGNVEGSPSKFKMPTFTLPKFGAATPKVSVEALDVKKDIEIDGATLDVAAPNIDTEGLSVDVKAKGGELEGSGSKFKMPKFGIAMPKVKGPEIDLSLSKKDADVVLPNAEAEVQLPDVNIKQPSATVEIKAPKIEAQAGNVEGSPSKFKMPTFTLPKFGAATPKVSVEVPDVKKDIEIDGATVDVTAPNIDTEGLSVDVKAKGGELEGSGSKFKMPKFGISMPKVKGPEIDLSLSKKDADVKLPEAKAQVELPDVNIKQPSATVEIKAPKIEAQAGNVEGSPSKFKMPTFTLPKFGAATPKVSVETLDVKKDIEIDGATLDVAAPNIDTEGLSVDVKAKGGELEGSGSKFKMPKFGIAMPKVKGPEIDLSLSKKDADVVLPNAEAEVQLPDVNIKQPSATVEIKAPKIEAQAGNVEGSPSKFKMPTFTLPKFGAATPKVGVEVPDVNKDIEIDGATVDVTAPSIDTEGLSAGVKTKGGDIEGSGSKFKIPKFGISMPKVKGPEIDLSLSKTDADVTLPDAKAEVQLPDVNIKQPSATVEIKAPKIEVQAGNVEGSPSKFKMPTFKFPKFGAEIPDIDKEIKIDGADLDTSMPHADVDVPDIKAEVHLPEVQVKKPSGGVVIEKQPSADVDTKLKKPRFSLPRFSFSKPSVKAPDVDASLQDVDVAFPEGKVEVKGECEAEVEGSKFKIPKFGITIPKVTGPEIDLSLSKKDADVTLPDAKAEVQLPDVNIKQPSATVEIKAPMIETQTGNVEGSPSKLKMPTFTLPKFGVTTPKVNLEAPDVNKDIEIDGATVDVTAPSIDTEGLSVDVKAKGGELEGSGSTFKMPKFGISMPKVKGPEIDLSLSKKGADVTLPEAKAQVELPDVNIKQPSATVEIKAPKIEAQAGNVEGSPSKFKLPTFKLPTFGAATPKVSVEVPDVNKDTEIDGATVDVTAPSIDTEGLAAGVKTKEGELEGPGSKFKIPKFGISMPKVKGPEIDLSSSKTDADVTLPDAKAEVQLPDVNIKQPSATVEIKAPKIEVQAGNVEGSPSKFKMPTFKFPKFGAEIPDIDKEIKINGADLDTSMPHADVDVPDIKAEVHLPEVQVKKPSGGVVIEKQPSVDVDTKLKKSRFSLPRFSFSKPSVKAPDVDASLQDGKVAVPEGKVEVKGECEAEVEGSKFKIPKFGITIPKVTGPEIDLSLSKKDADVTLPDAKAEVQLPDVNIKQPSATVEIKAPTIEAQAGNVEGSPSKLKMPTFTLPRFGAATPKVNLEAPDVKKDIEIGGATVDVIAPNTDTEGLSVDVKAKGGDIEGSGSKFKMPKFGISMPKVKEPEIDLSLSKKDVDVMLPEAKAEVQLPDVNIKHPSATVEIKAPKIEAQAGNVEGSPSKFKMPTFTLPKFGAATPKVSVEAPDVKKDIEIDGTTVDVTAPSIDTEGLSVDVKAKGGELEGSGSKFKIPKFGISMSKVKGPEIDLSLSKKDADVTLPEANAELKLCSVEVKKTEVEIEAPEIKVASKDTEGSPSKFKMPTFKLPKFGVGTPSTTVEVPDMDKDIKIDGTDIQIPEEVLTVHITAPSIDTAGPSIDTKTIGTEHEGKGGKFKLPGIGFSGPQVKQHDTDLSLSNKGVDMTLPEAKADVKLSSVEVKEPEGAISGHDAPTVEVESKLKRPSWTFPKFSFSRTGKTPDVDVTLETPKVDVTSPEAKAEVHSSSGVVSMQEPPSIELDANLKKHKFSLPRFSFSRSSVKEPEVSAEHLRVDVSLPEGEVIVKQPDMKIKVEEHEESKFKFPKSKGPEEDLNASQKDVDITLPEVNAMVRLPEIEGKLAETGGTKLKNDVTVNIKDPNDDIKTEVSKAADSEMPNTETDNGGIGSPSKFKLPLFTSFGDILKNIDVEFDVPKTDQNIETSNEVHEMDESSTKQVEAKEKETKQDTAKSPERTGWFRFPRFGLSSPSQPTKSPEKDEHKDEKSPVIETVGEEISPTCSVQSSDAFADVSSAMTSEHVGLSLSSPTKVTVKYSDPNAAAGFGEMHGNIITSTTRTELISVEPNIPEKITILSSGVSSSSEDTLRLKSEKIHIITSKIQATPEAQHGKLLTAVHTQSAGGPPLESEANDAAMWTVEDSQGGKKTVFKKHLVRETSTERSESKETIVITKQITRSSEPISGETASSIQRLRDSVHSEKMRFFDGADE